ETVLHGLPQRIDSLRDVLRPIVSVAELRRTTDPGRMARKTEFVVHALAVEPDATAGSDRRLAAGLSFLADLTERLQPLRDLLLRPGRHGWGKGNARHEQRTKQ